MKAAAALSLIFAAATAGANPNVPAPLQGAPLLISNATLHTVSGPVITNGRMLVEHGRIAAIGGAEVKAPAGALTVDLNGAHVYPGMVSANSSLGLTEVASVRATVDTAETGSLNPNARAVVAFNADSELIPVTRAGGVLAALSVPLAGPNGLIAGTSALMQLEGWNWQDMTLVPEVALHITLPSLRHGAALFPGANEQRLGELKRGAAARLKLLEDSFESARAYAAARKAEPSLAQDTRWDALLPVLGGQRPVFIRADEQAQIRWALDFAERFALKLVIVGGADSAGLAEQLKARDVSVILTGLQRLPLRRDDMPDAQFSLPARLAAAGVRFCIARGGGNADGANERNLPFEAAQARAYGLSKEEALKAVTLYPAQIIGAADRLGSLEAGKLASFIVSNGDPLDIRTRIMRVYVQGREIELKDRQTQLRDKYERRIP